MEENVNERIKGLITHLGMSNNSFAKSIGMTSTAINSVVGGRTKPSFDFMQSVCGRYPQIDPAWLLKGEGGMLRAMKPVDLKPDDYLQEYLASLETQFKELKEMFSMELSVKNRQIEKLMDLLGKLEGVSIEPVCETESHSKKGGPTPFFMPFHHKFGYTPGNSMVAGSF